MALRQKLVEEDDMKANCLFGGAGIRSVDRSGRYSRTRKIAEVLRYNERIGRNINLQALSPEILYGVHFHWAAVESVFQLK
jgi:hypothetical protein